MASGHAEDATGRLGQRFRDALGFALEAHTGQVRKGSGTPYVAHPLQVAGIAIEHGADEDQAIAALLHDVIEDTSFSHADLEQRFGRRVADIVQACSDADGPEDKPAWRERKERYLAHLAEADADLALVSCADKLHNARSILTDLRTHGEAVWERFKGRRDGSLWYYGRLVEVLADREVPAGLLRELTGAVQAIHEESPGRGDAT